MEVVVDQVFYNLLVAVVAQHIRTEVAPSNGVSGMAGQNDCIGSEHLPVVQLLGCDIL